MSPGLVYAPNFHSGRGEGHSPPTNPVLRSNRKADKSAGLSEGPQHRVKVTGATTLRWVIPKVQFDPASFTQCALSIEPKVWDLRAII